MTITQLLNNDLSALQFDGQYAEIPQEINPVPNTTMTVRSTDGGQSLRTVRIQAVDGYTLHDTNYDTTVYDDETGEPTGEVRLGYHGGVVSCAASYQFTPTEMQDENGNTVTAYGTRQFFTKLESDVGEGADIFGTTDQPEVM